MKNSSKKCENKENALPSKTSTRIRSRQPLTDQTNNVNISISNMDKKSMFQINLRSGNRKLRSQTTSTPIKYSPLKTKSRPKIVSPTKTSVNRRTTKSFSISPKAEKNAKNPTKVSTKIRLNTKRASTNKSNKHNVTYDVEHMKSAYVLLERMSEKKCEKSPVRKSNRLAIYDFEYDPNEEPKPKTKSKKGRPKIYLNDSSGDENNSMKEVIKKLRKVERKMKQVKTNEKKKENHADNKENPQPVTQNNKKQTIKPEAANKNQRNAIVENRPEKINTVSQPTYKVLDEKPQPVAQNNKKSTIKPEAINKNQQNSTLEKTPEKINPVSQPTSEVLDDCISDDIDDNGEILPLEEQIEIPVHSKTIAEEVIDSFLADEEQENENNQPYSQKQSRSNISSVNSPNPYKSIALNTSKEIFNSTMTTSEAPWRLNFSTIRKRPYAFTVKDKSFIPSYNPDIISVSNKSVGDKSSEKSSKSLDKNISEKSGQKNTERKTLETAEASSSKNEVSLKKKSEYQSSILSFVSSSKKTPKKQLQGGLFEDLATPRKVLSNLNIGQSTPINSNISVESYEADISAQSPRKEDNLFGFSFISDDENNDKENLPHRRSPRKKKSDLKKNLPTRISFGEIKAVMSVNKPQTQPTVEPIEQEKETIRIPTPLDSDVSVALFEDVEPNFEVQKKSRRSYERKRPRRRRLPSIDSVESDESDVEKPAKKKHKDGRTKEEEQEADRLASLYNSMFEEIEQHALIIE